MRSLVQLGLTVTMSVHQMEPVNLLSPEITMDQLTHLDIDYDDHGVWTGGFNCSSHKTDSLLQAQSRVHAMMNMSLSISESAIICSFRMSTRQPIAIQISWFIIICKLTLYHFQILIA